MFLASHTNDIPGDKNPMFSINRAFFFFFFFGLYSIMRDSSPILLV